jgi:hypothetical protein
MAYFAGQKVVLPKSILHAKILDLVYFRGLGMENVAIF